MDEIRDKLREEVSKSNSVNFLKLIEIYGDLIECHYEGKQQWSNFRFNISLIGIMGLVTRTFGKIKKSKS